LKKIIFLLPEYYNIPIGGYRVVFEYANRLANDGFKVKIVYPFFLFFRNSTFKRKIKMLIKFIYYKIIYQKIKYNWFPVDRRVSSKFVLTLRESHVPQADIYISTSMETSYHLENYSFVSNENKIYLIQGFEDWNWGKIAVTKTWCFNLQKIVVSDWLYSMVSQYDLNVKLIHNGVNREGLYYKECIKSRNKYAVMMLYHKQTLKGSIDGIKILCDLKLQYPELKAILFGTSRRPKILPKWIEYFCNPSNSELNSLYNRASIYVGTSKNEGFGLTIGEAMICGCAIISTDAGGYLTLVKNMETGLISKVGDLEHMKNNIILLLNNDKLRYLLAERGNKLVKKFTWDNAYKNFQELVKK
jgi:glycosyltransferase involved in cell wall biosynthesis